MKTPARPDGVDIDPDRLWNNLMPASPKNETVVKVV